MRTILLALASQTPWALMLAKDGNVIYAVRYLAYEHQDQVDPSLFVKPTGIEFTDPLK